MFGRKETGGAVEILIERVTGSHEAMAQLGVSKKPKESTAIELADGTLARVLGRDGEFFRLRFESAESLEKLLLKLGRMPLPPYIERTPDASDSERYQTIFAREPGAVAAPTAGLHFDEALLDRLAERGVESGHITLHVGAGRYSRCAPRNWPTTPCSRMAHVGANSSKRSIKRVRVAERLAVGTTVVVRSNAQAAMAYSKFAGETQIFIFPATSRSIEAC